jgi:hypothetical protein
MRKACRARRRPPQRPHRPGPACREPGRTGIWWAACWPTTPPTCPPLRPAHQLAQLPNCWQPRTASALSKPHRLPGQGDAEPAVTGAGSWPGRRLARGNAALAAGSPAGSGRISWPNGFATACRRRAGNGNFFSPSIIRPGWGADALVDRQQDRHPRLPLHARCVPAAIAAQVAPSRLPPAPSSNRGAGRAQETLAL